MPVAGVEHDAVERGRGIPATRAADGEAALHSGLSVGTTPWWANVTLTKKKHVEAYHATAIMREMRYGDPCQRHAFAAGPGDVHVNANEIIVKLAGDNTHAAIKMTS
jgi:hypothetical protein